MIDLNAKLISDYYATRGYETTYDEENDVPLIVIKPSEDVKLYIALIENLDFGTLQFVTDFPYEIDKEKIDELKKFIAYLNLEMEFPSLVLDESEEFLMHRAVAPAVMNQFDEGFLDSFMTKISRTMKNYSTAIIAIMSGQLTVAQLVEAVAEGEE